MLILFKFLQLLSNGLNLRRDSSIIYSRIGLGIIIYAIIYATLGQYMTFLDKGLGLLGGLFNVTIVTHTFQIFILLVCKVIILMTAFYYRKKFISETLSLTNTLFKKVKEYSTIINKMSEQFTIIEYALIIIFTIIGAMLLICSADFGSIYLCIELQSFSLYIICALHRNSESSTGSALIYFLLGGLSSCFILLGIALIYSNTGLTNTDSIYCAITDNKRMMLLSSEPELTSEQSYFSDWAVYYNNFAFYSFLLISTGFLFKIAAAPFHWWSPDVYDGVPTIVTTFIAILGKIAILVLFIELVQYTGLLNYQVSNWNDLVKNVSETNSWTITLSISCLFSFIIGTVAGLTQIRIKRLLAYSTISHIAFILLALLVQNIESYQAYLFYIMQYILTNLNAFFVILAIGYSLYLYYTNVTEYNNLSEKDNSPIQLINQMKGYFSINPLLALCLVIIMFSFVGLPPLLGFFAKQMVLISALDNNMTILVLVAIITSVIGAVYYLNVIKVIQFDRTEYEKPYIYVEISISNYLSISIAILILIILTFMLVPDLPLDLCNSLATVSYSDIFKDTDIVSYSAFKLSNF